MESMPVKGNKLVMQEIVRIIAGAKSVGRMKEWDPELRWASTGVEILHPPQTGRKANR